MSLPRKRKLLAILCRPEVKDRMDLIDMWTVDPSEFTEQQKALWDAADGFIDPLDNDEAPVSDINQPTLDVVNAMDAI